MNEILAVVGLAGTGKSTVVKLLHSLTGAPVVYFGGVVVQEVRRRGMQATETTERSVREEMRANFGMAAIAVAAAPEIDTALEQFGRVLIDGVYSLAEFEFIDGRYPGLVRTLAVHAPRALREKRLGERPLRPLTPPEVRSRDLSEIGTLDKATPIVLADYHVINDSSIEDLESDLKNLVG